MLSCLFSTGLVGGLCWFGRISSWRCWGRLQHWHPPICPTVCSVSYQEWLCLGSSSMLSPSVSAPFWCATIVIWLLFAMGLLNIRKEMQHVTFRAGVQIGQCNLNLWANWTCAPQRWSGYLLRRAPWWGRYPHSSSPLAKCSWLEWHTVWKTGESCTWPFALPSFFLPFTAGEATSYYELLLCVNC